MKKITKTAFITAFSIMTIGGATYGIGIANGGKTEILRVNHKIYQKSDLKISKDSKELSKFDSIDINMKAANVQIVQSDKYKIETSSNQVYKVQSDIKDNKLIVKGEGGYGFAKYVSVNGKQFGESYEKNEIASIKIYVPKDANLSNINIKAGDGSTKVNNINCDNITIDTNSSNVELVNIKSNTINLKNIYYDTQLKNIETEELNLQYTNDVYIDNVKAKKLNIVRGRGMIDSKNLTVDEATLDSDSIQFEKFTANKVDIPNAPDNVYIQGKINGSTNIKSDNALDIRLNLDNANNEFNYNLQTKDNYVSINNQKYGEKFQQDNKSANNMNIDASRASIIIKTK